MSGTITREEMLRSFLVGEQVQAARNGLQWNEAQSREKFGRFIAAERFEALGVDQESVDTGARTLMRITKTGWDGATDEQRLTWQKVAHGVLSAVRDNKLSAPPALGRPLPVPKRPEPVPEPQSETVPEPAKPRAKSKPAAERKAPTAPRPKKVREHGTRAKYVKEGCPCLKCRKADQAYKNALRKKKKAGELPLVPAGRSRNLLNALIVGKGAKPEHLAKAMGFAPSSLIDIASGHTQRVRVATEEKIIETARQAGVEQESA